MIREGMKHGFPSELWNAAKAEARDAIVRRAKASTTITYSDLVKEIASIRLEPQEMRLAHMLDEISSEENAAGRGMLTVLVVHKSGDQGPGPGFYTLAKRLGRNVRDQDEVWINEHKKVIGFWSVG